MLENLLDIFQIPWKTIEFLSSTITLLNALFCNQICFCNRPFRIFSKNSIHFLLKYVQSGKTRLKKCQDISHAFISKNDNLRPRTQAWISTSATLSLSPSIYIYPERSCQRSIHISYIQISFAHWSTQNFVLCWRA